MRTISALLLFATTFFSHGQGHLANPVPFGFSVDLEMARIISYETDVIQITDEIIEIYISLEVYFEEFVLEPEGLRPSNYYRTAPPAFEHPIASSLSTFGDHKREAPKKLEPFADDERLFAYKRKITRELACSCKVQPNGIWRT